MSRSRVSEVLRSRLSKRERASTLRHPRDGLVRQERAWVDVSSNDYLGFASDPVSRETLSATAGACLGAGASRLIHGTRPEQLELESALADWVGFPTALVFTSGYAANVGVVSALAGPGDLVISDALNHASLIDGCRLGRADVTVVPHRDLDAIRAALARPASMRWVVTESYFSMDGSTPDLPALRALCDTAEAGLIVDEAHALGVFGPSGAGLCQRAGVQPDALIGTLGKAVGAQGAFVAGCEPVIHTIWNSARSFVFSTGFSPWLAAAITQRVRTVVAADGLRQRLAEHVDLLTEALPKNLRLPDGRHGPIFPILLGANRRALDAAAALREAGFLAQAIRPPTVPPGTARLRISLTARLEERALCDLAAVLEKACSESS